MRLVTFPLALLFLTTLPVLSAAQDSPLLAPPSASVVVGAPSGRPLAGDRLEAATKEVTSLLRCPVCQGAAVWDSPATMAVNMKRQARDLLAEGFSPDQVLRYFASSYGEFVLLAPPKDGIALVIWTLPAVFLIGGAAVIWRLFARARGAAPESSTVVDARIASPGKPTTTMVTGLAVVGVLAALIMLANATATSRLADGRPTEQRTTAPAVAGETQTQSGDERITGVIELDASVARSVTYPAVVFVYARPENVSAGPPVAALRLQVSSFPAAFSLGPEHAMMGGALPRKIRIDVRIDPDGNASTREPDAPHAFVDGVETGTTNLGIVLE